MRIGAAFAFIAFGLTACDRSMPEVSSSMAAEDVIRQNANSPVGQSIVPVAISLVQRTVFVPLENSPSATVVSDTLLFKTAEDNRGRMWAYAYTTQAELLRTFPQGSAYAKLGFKDFFQIVDRDGRFAGIMLNSGSDTSYPIPREVFEKVQEGLWRAADE